jgi:hypothetical protein
VPSIGRWVTGGNPHFTAIFQNDVDHPLPNWDRRMRYFQHRSRNPFTCPVQRPDRIAGFLVFHGYGSVWGSDTCPGSQANGTGSDTGNAFLDRDPALAINSPADQKALLVLVCGA